MEVADPLRPANGCCRGVEKATTAPPHILLVALPAPGHLFPFTSLAYKLAAAGLQVTCLSTGHVFENLQHRGHQKFVQNSSSSNNMLRFENLLEDSKEFEVTVYRVMEWCQEQSDDHMKEALGLRFRQLRPRPCCIVSDMFLGWVQDVANKFNVPRHTLFTMPAKDLAFILRLPKLIETGELPYSAMGDKREIDLPGMAPIQADDVWETFRDSSHPHHGLFVRTFLRMNESSSIFVNSFEELEKETLQALRTDFVAAHIKVPEVLPILLSDIPNVQTPNVPNNATSNSDLEVSEVEKWLDTRAPASVIYISFGSLATLPEQHIEKLALALETTKYPFLWVFRPPQVPHVNHTLKSTTPNGQEQYFAPGFQERIRGRAMVITGWAPQPQILAHPATGAFLTHCGWNSVLESTCSGVPLLAWPLWEDQRINARFITDTARVGLRIHRNEDDTVEQDEIEKVLRQMMQGDEGQAARSRAQELQLLSHKAVADGGASTLNLQKIVRHCASLSSTIS